MLQSCTAVALKHDSRAAHQEVDSNLGNGDKNLRTYRIKNEVVVQLHLEQVLVLFP